MFSCWEQLQCHVFMLKKNNNKQTLKCCVFMLSTTTVTGCFPIEYNHSIVFSGWVQLLFCVSSLSTHIVWSYSVVFSCWVQLSCCVFRLSTTIVFSCWVQLTIMLCFQDEYNCCVSMLSTTIMLCFQVEYNYKFLNCPIECIEDAKKRGEFQPMMTLNVSQTLQS